MVSFVFCSSELTLIYSAARSWLVVWLLVEGIVRAFLLEVYGTHSEYVGHLLERVWVAAALLL
jgi:hypothetical protein